jgi:hypothetical protein
MSILEQFRNWLQGEMKTADEGIKAETEKGLDYLKKRTEYHLGTMRRDYEAFLDGLVRGEEPVTIDAVPVDRGLAAPDHDPVTGEVYEKPEREPERAQWHGERQSRRGRKKKEAAPQETAGSQGEGMPSMTG